MFRPATSAILLGLMASAVSLPGCKPPKEEAENATVPTNVTEEPPAPKPPATIDRAALLDALAAAASDYSAGSDDRLAQSALDGRPFAVRLPFGCPGQPVGKSLTIAVRPDGGSYEVRASPDLGSADIDPAPSKTGVADAATPSVQVVEGFWIDRPWLRKAQCPATTAPAIETALTMTADPSGPALERTAAIGQYQTDTDSRLALRAGRDYRKLVSLSSGQAVPDGLFLLLEGRLRAWPDGKVIHCRAPLAGARPSCIASATFDRVAIERIDDKSVVAEWSAQ